MSMDYSYQSWHQQVDELHYRIQDAFDIRDHPAFRNLQVQLRDLITDFSLQRSPHNIEDRVKGIIQLLEPARNGSQTFMSVPNAVTFHDAFERLRREVRGHPHYS